MRALTQIAGAEFRKAFRWNYGTPSVRDCAWLRLFFCLWSFLAFFGLSARQGLWPRFEQVLLGALPESSPPVIVGYNFIERPEKITARLIAQFRSDFRDLSIVPMRRFDGKGDAVVLLPGLAVTRTATTTADLLPERQREKERKIDQSLSWGLSKEGGNNPLRIFALPVDAPVWRWAAEQLPDQAAGLQKPFPTVLAASKTFFARHFRYENYRKAIMENQAVPCVLRNSLPEHLKNPQDPTELKSLVLEVKEGFLRTAFHAFDVIWVDSFPMPEQVALILPLPTAELLMARDTRDKLDLNLEGRGEPSERVQQIWLHDIEDNRLAQEKFRQMSACLGAVTAAAARNKHELACNAEWDRNPDCDISGACAVPRLRGDDNDLMITAGKQWPLRQSDITTCADGAKFGDIFSSAHPLQKNIKIDFTEPTPRFVWRGPAQISVPCAALIESDFITDSLNGQQNNADCKTKKPQPQGSSGTAWLDGYPDAMVYSVAGDNSKEIVARLLDWKPDGIPVFSLDPAYESALVRFGVLSTIIDRLSWPMGFGLVVLYLALSYIMLATAFLHRRAQYGLLVMAGVLPSQLKHIVGLQILFASTIGCAAGFILFRIIALGVDYWLTGSPVVGQARELIGLEVTTFFGHLTAIHVGLFWWTMSALNVLLGGALLSAQRISTAKAPIDLIKS
jgi:hypothetical protein